MLSPELKTFTITPDIRDRIADTVFEALFRSVGELPVRQPAAGGAPALTVTEAKERLQMVLPQYADTVGRVFPLGEAELGMTAREFGAQLHEWINEASVFFRREGADCLREGLALATEEAFSRHVWQKLFERRLFALAQSRDMLKDEGAVQTCDLVMESMKRWTAHVCRHLWGIDATEFDPGAFFLDTETEVHAELNRDGQRILLRGKPDAIFFDQRSSEIHVWEYKFGRQGRFELQVAQVLLYMALIESAKGVRCSGGHLTLFTVTEQQTDAPFPAEARADRSRGEAFPPAVRAAFEGFVGNDPAVYRLKVQLTLALREDPPRTAFNAMLCGPGGTGKTELARRVANALGTPFVDVPATTLRDLDDLVSRIDAVLEHHGLDTERDGVDSGLDRYRYPPLVVFVDEVHTLARRADAFLNLFEPKERRAVCRNRVGDFRNAAFLTATTEKGRLPGPFRSRFRIIDLEPYTLEEVSRIAQQAFAASGVPCPVEVGALLAKVGRLVPRTVIETAGNFIELHQFSPHAYPISVPGIEEAMSRVWNVDPNGLTNNDREYLTALESGPKGLSALTAMLSANREEIERIIEPYLIQLAAIRHTPRGREITEMGRSMLSADAP